MHAKYTFKHLSTCEFLPGTDIFVFSDVASYCVVRGVGAIRTELCHQNADKNCQ